jgi:hypothetical protein
MTDSVVDSDRRDLAIEHELDALERGEKLPVSGDTTPS